MRPLETAVAIAGGVGFFLLGMAVMTDGLKALAGSALRTVLAKAAATSLSGTVWGAVVILQLIFTYTAPLQAMFGNEAIPLRIWLWLLAGGLAFFLVVEAEKLVIRSSASLRRAVTAAETGA